MFITVYICCKKNENTSDPDMRFRESATFSNDAI